MNLLDADDLALIDAARAAIRDRFAPGRHVVGAALRTRAGRLFTGIHLETSVGRIAVCAEAIAIGRAATEAGDTAIATIVAVYHLPDGTAPVVAPCGMCREMIADYAPGARVIVPGSGGTPATTSIAALLPGRFAHPRSREDDGEPCGTASVETMGAPTSD